MSSSPGNREVAHRVFATEFDDANLSYSESDEERAPNYVVTPGGARINRLFAVGVLTEVERINEDTLRGRVVDPTGAFVTYAGQYQPDEQAFLDNTTPPAFVALSGKARTFQPDDSDIVYTSVRPESLNDVDADTRDRWTVTAAQNTLRRVALFDAALRSDLTGDDLEASLRESGVEAHLAAGIPRAIDHYGTTRAYLEGLRRVAVDALEVVAGEREEVRPLDVDPADPGPAELGALPEVDVDLAAPTTTAEPTESVEETVESETAESEAESTAETEADSAAEPETAPATEPDTESVSEPETEPEPETETEPEPETEPVSTEEPAAAESESTATESARTVAAEAPTESADEAEPATEPESEESSEGGLGDFAEPDGESVQETVAEEAEELGDFDPEETAEDGLYELDEDERREVEEEFGTEFSTGSEVESPGEADIDVPESETDLEEVDAEAAEAAEAEAGGGAPAVEPEAEPAEPETVEPAESETEPAESEAETAETEAEPQPEIEAEDVDLEDAVVDAMKDLDEGDGADRDEVTAAVVQRTGADPGDVEDAIQEALLGGKCYEPADGTLKAI